MPGRLIVLEGVDGVGKTTLSWALARAIDGQRLSTPGEALAPVRPIVDAALEAHPRARQLFYAASVVAVGEQADTWRNQGVDVVVDRYWLTNRAYADARGDRLPLDAVEAALPRADRRRSAGRRSRRG